VVLVLDAWDPISITVLLSPQKTIFLEAARLIQECCSIASTTAAAAAAAATTTTTRPPTTNGDGSFVSVFSQEEAKFWVDKTGFIPLLEALGAKAVVSLRPRRMGKTLWKDTLVHYYDAQLKDRFKELFGHLDIGKAPTQLANSFHVLPLTFAGLKTDAGEKFETSLNNVLDTAAAKFKRLYNLSFELNEQDSLDTFVRLANEIQLKREKVQAASQTPLLFSNMLLLC